MSNTTTRIVSIATLAATPGVAYAQTLPADVPAATDAEYQAETGTAAGAEVEIIVTARKRGERLLDVPIAITAVTAQTLQARAVNSVNELATAVPNVRLPANTASTQTSGAYAYGMRGVVTNARNIGFEPGVGTYVDGVYVSRATAFNQVLSDIERVEILRGPQGTLFGKNTIAGAINIITKEPSDSLEGSVSVGIGNRSAWRTDAYISGPISDNVSAKISGYHSEKDGQLRNVLDDTDYLNADNTTSVRGAVRLEPSSDFSLIFAGDYTHSNTPGSGLQLARVSGMALTVPGVIAGDGEKINIDGAFGTPNFSKRDEWGVSMTAQIGIGANELTSITAFRDTTLHFTSDDDATPWPIQYSDFNDSAEAFSQELRIASTNRDFWNYLIGAYYFSQKASADRFTLAAPPDALNSGPFYPIYLTKPTTSGRISLDAGVKTDAWSLFTSNDLKLTSNLDLTIGLRYTEERKKLDLTQNDTSWIRFPSINIDGQSRKDDDISGNVSVTYKPTTNSSIYASISRGFKSGGFNADYGRSQVTFGPEKVTSYEIGAKAILFDRMVNLNANAFYIDYSGQQVNSFINGAFFIQNAGTSKIKGIEAEISLYPTEGLSLNGSFGYTDATFEEFPNCNGPNTSCAGNRLPYVSKFTGYASAQYRIPMRSGDITPRLEWAYTGDSYFDAQNNQYNRVPSYSIINGTLALRRDQWKLTLWAKNIFNKHYDVARWDFASLFGIFYHTPGETRTFGADVRYDF